MSGFLCSMVGATYAPAVAQTAVAFDGSGDFYEATSLTTTATDSNKLLIAGTIYWAGGNNLQQIVNVRLGTGGSDYGFWVWINGGRMQCKMASGTGSVPTSIYEDTENSLTQNAYNQFVIYWDTGSYTTNTKIYVNGVSKAISNEGTSANNWNWGNTATTVKIGQKNSSQTGDGTDFNGRIAQLYIHNGNGLPEIGKFWDSTNSRPYDLGTQGTGTGLPRPLIYHYGNTSTFPTNNGTGFASYTLTASGGVTSAAGPTYSTAARTAKTLTTVGNAQVDTAQSKFGGASYLGDGTGDYLASTAGTQWDFGTSSFTIEYWIRFNAINTLYVPIALRASGSIAAGEWWCEVTAAENKMYWGFKNQAGTQYYVNLALAGTAFATGQFYHIALVNNAGTAQMYVNGTATGTTTAISGSFGTSGTDLWVGAGAGAYSVNGWMDEVRISNTARYTSGFTPSASAFTNDSNTLLLIHANGIDASTIFTDDNL